MGNVSWNEQDNLKVEVNPYRKTLAPFNFFLFIFFRNKILIYSFCYCLSCRLFTTTAHVVYMHVLQQGLRGIFQGRFLDGDNNEPFLHNVH